MSSSTATHLPLTTSICHQLFLIKTAFIFFNAGNQILLKIPKYELVSDAVPSLLMSYDKADH